MTYVLIEHVEENTLWEIIIENEGLVIDCDTTSETHSLAYRLNKYRSEVKKQLPDLAPEYEKYMVKKRGQRIIVEPRKFNTNLKLSTLDGEEIDAEEYTDE